MLFFLENHLKKSMTDPRLQNSTTEVKPGEGQCWYKPGMLQVVR